VQAKIWRLEGEQIRLTLVAGDIVVFTDVDFSGAGRPGARAIDRTTALAMVRGLLKNPERLKRMRGLNASKGWRRLGLLGDEKAGAVAIELREHDPWRPTDDFDVEVGIRVPPRTSARTATDLMMKVYAERGGAAWPAGEPCPSDLDAEGIESSTPSSRRGPSGAGTAGRGLVGGLGETAGDSLGH
jgi:hypothetical protein